MLNILITGGSGMIGSRLTKMLLAKGHAVSHLERSKKDSAVSTFKWDVTAGIVDKAAFKGIDTIVHLAGAGIADKRWSHDRKKEILESRTQSTSLLFDTLKEGGHQVKTFVCASAIGYYGIDCSDRPIIESDAAGTDFLAHVTQRWEYESDKIRTLGLRVVNVRTGIVLSKSGGALPKLLTPVKLYVGAPLGSGTQMMSWIHIDDHCGILIKAIEDQKLSGAYNSVAPHPVSNEVLTRAIAKVVHRPIIIPRVPSFVLRTLLGEMASTVTTGCNVSSAKIEATGYVFQYRDVEEAIEAALK
ncbi:MAG: TIGR01777 family oxidoreductase [Chryseolinea sp.]